MRKVIMPEMEVARAKPPNFIGNISIELRIMFIIKAKVETFAGVAVSFKAKKQDCNILVEP